jgi:Alpha-glutamyl/putrescinyl thymine pyrophosphorylase clade 3
VRVRREDRAEDDGYRSELLPGLRASADATRLVEEIAFSSGRLLALAAAPPDLYAEVRALAEHDLELATWTCLLIAYLSPLQGEDPFAGIREALRRKRGGLEDLNEIPLGPRTSHDPARGTDTLSAYRKWVEQASSQELAFAGNADWSPRRRFERLFERLALPGFPRRGRYELLVMLGRLGLYELRADSLHLSAARGLSVSDPATLGAKRVFAIGDPLHLDRRGAALAEAVSVPVETLDLALANWGVGERATLGFPPETCDRDTLHRARPALGL